MNWRTPLIRLLGTSIISVLFTLIVSVALSLGPLPSALAGGNAPAPLREASRGFITQSLASEFNTCDVLTSTISQALTDTVVSSANAGEIRLASYLEDYFDGTTLDTSKWITVTGLGITLTPSFDVVRSINDGYITMANSYLRSVNSIPLDGRIIDIRARLQDPAYSNPDANIGFSRADFPGPPANYPPTGSCAAYPADCEGAANRLYITAINDVPVGVHSNARDGLDPSTNIPLTQTVGITDFHVYHIDWNSVNTQYYVDGQFYPTSTFTSTFVYSPYVWLLNWNPGDPIQVDWVRVYYYPTSTGQFQSCAFTGVSGYSAFSWANITWTADLPVGTSVGFETRTSPDGSTWSAWVPVAADGATSNPTGLYFQYRATLTSTDVNASPEIQEVRIHYFGPNAVTVRGLAAYSGASAPSELVAAFLFSLGISLAGVVAWRTERRSNR